MASYIFKNMAKGPRVITVTREKGLPRQYPLGPGESSKPIDIGDQDPDDILGPWGESGDITYAEHEEEEAEEKEESSSRRRRRRKE